MEQLRLVLASRSPRRRSLLSKLVADFEVAVPEVDENAVSGVPSAVAERLAREKAAAVAEQFPGALILAADTVIDLEGRLLGKPANPEEASAILNRLAGRTHRVITGVAVAWRPTTDVSLLSGIVISEVTLRRVSPAELRAYVASGEPMDKAGAYAIQGKGRNLIAGFAGCYYNIVGLPLCETARLLLEAGWRGKLDPSQCRLPEGGVCPRVTIRGN